MFVLVKNLTITLQSPNFLLFQSIKGVHRRCTPLCMHKKMYKICFYHFGCYSFNLCSFINFTLNFLVVFVKFVNLFIDFYYNLCYIIFVTSGGGVPCVMMSVVMLNLVVKHTIFLQFYCCDCMMCCVNSRTRVLLFIFLN